MTEDNRKRVSEYPSHEEWARDYPEQDAELAEKIINAVPFELGPLQLDQLKRDAWAKLALEEMELDGVVYKNEDGAYMLTGDTDAEPY